METPISPIFNSSQPKLKSFRSGQWPHIEARICVLYTVQNWKRLVETMWTCVPLAVSQFFTTVFLFFVFIFVLYLSSIFYFFKYLYFFHYSSVIFLNFLNDFYFFYHGWFTVFCQFLLYSKVTQSYIYIYSFAHIILHHVPS